MASPEKPAPTMTTSTWEGSGAAGSGGVSCSVWSRAGIGLSSSVTKYNLQHRNLH